MDMGSDRSRAWVLPPDLVVVGEARRLVADACGDLPLAKVDDARLLVTELVANAVQHGSGDVLLIVARAGAGVRVEVVDEGLELPVITESRPLMERGAGLRLVEALASSWGVAERVDGEPGKRVWFALT